MTKITATVHEDQYAYIFLSYLAQLFLEREMFRTKVVQKIKTHFMFNNFFFIKSWHLWDHVEKYGATEQAKDDNMAHARCILDN